ncbi:hypothetical protein [Scytonema millei]|uniref:Uncharacterized protein n=1 Tax=Scytonema millei VB511283 TaxID=1245923 RepID=A0A9X5E848_9CYAN|nr:hypothetical protein [Scytonema millei]NHC36894.1 hypothetical protein [Scytonema millei VB511283]
MSITTGFALLASVPQEHLEDGLECLPKVAFGSRAGEVFAEADYLRKGNKVRVLIYESHSTNPIRPPQISWTGVYIGQVQAVGKNKAHPHGDAYRPQRAFLHDTPGHWLIYWEVESLMRLPEAERFAISALRGLAVPNSRHPKPYYASSFKPEKPHLIEYRPLICP